MSKERLAETLALALELDQLGKRATALVQSRRGDTEAAKADRDLAAKRKKAKAGRAAAKKHAWEEIPRGDHPYPVARCMSCGVRARRAVRKVRGREHVRSQISRDGGRSWSWAARPGGCEGGR